VEINEDLEIERFRKSAHPEDFLLIVIAIGRIDPDAQPDVFVASLLQGSECRDDLDVLLQRTEKSRQRGQRGARVQRLVESRSVVINAALRHGLVQARHVGTRHR